ncbi:MAG TPA: membrane protein insertase YidC [Burkholderiales bacterium]|nr:membrane protein insertase YidC [Burkholderiales bacterium]
MDNQRAFLFLLFFFSTFFLFQAWEKEKQASIEPSASAGNVAAGVPANSTITPAQIQPILGEAPASAAAGGQKVHVETDFLIAEIDTDGGTLSRLELRKHRDTRDKNFLLFERDPQHTYVAQSGLLGGGLPDHHAHYVAAAQDYRLDADADHVTVRLTASDSGAWQVVKTFTFHRASYVIDVGYEVENKASTAARADAYFQFVRDGKPPEGSPAMAATFTGAAVYTEKEKFHKISFADIDKGKANYPKTSNDGWIALLQHYFLGAWLPEGSVAREFYVRRLDDELYSIGVILPLGTISPGQRATLTVPLYAGPQEQDKLAALAPGLNLTVDYGWLTVIAAPLFWLLRWLHQCVGNWGGAIIVLTVIIKAVFYPLSAASYRSMARMRVLAPRLQKLREHYADDRQRLNQAMMELYRTEKINPLGGCLPVLVQIPVFISLYWVLLASVELRHAPFILWIKDLSAPDPYYLLPALMAATMIAQTALNPKPPDPVQASVMKIMPIVFSIFFFFFPAGLVLYWLVNNVLSMLQQWYINRSLERVGLGRKAP